MGTFSGKRCIVTGAGQGIGRAIAVELAGLGAHVIAVSRTASHLETLAQEVPAIQIIACDVENLEDLQEKIHPHLPVDLLVNNAGTNIPEDFLKVTPVTFDRVFNVNFKSAFFLSQWVVKSMIEHKIKGSIVHISSQASKVYIPAHTAYSTSKAALDNLTKNMACELGPHGIRVNAVNPTVVMTELAKQYWGDPAKAKTMIPRIPLRQFAEWDDVVKAVTYLLSDDAKMITGVCMPVDGGACAM